MGTPDYTPVALYEAIVMAVARVSNRVYVGTEFCETSSSNNPRR